jgi:hypothetical protein
VDEAMHRQALSFLPPPNGSFGAAEIDGNLLPGIETVVPWIAQGRREGCRRLR